MQINKNYKFLGFLLLTTLMFSCVEKFWPELNTNDTKVLVVDGGITNMPGPYNIKLSYTSSIDSIAHFPATNFTVNISDDLGNSETLQEINEGEYITSESGIQGHVGRKYKIELNSPNGSSYASNYVELLAPVNIQSFYGNIENKATLDDEQGQIGYQFYIDTEAIANDSTYFLWKLDQTYEYHSDYTADYIMKANDTLIRETTVAEAQGYFTCWQTDKVREVFTYNPSILNTSNITHFPLNYVNTDTRELSIRYSLLVKQYSIDLNTYHFWNSIEKMNSNQGSMYTRQPYQVQGNVTNLDKPDEVVLGYFMVAGVDEERIFVNRLPRSYNYYYDVCIPNDADLERTDQFWKKFYEKGILPDYDKLFHYYGMGFGTFLPPQTCINCTLKGGTNIKPDFWIDE